MPKYEFDTVRWLRNVAEVQSHRAGAGPAMLRENMLKCAVEIERLRMADDMHQQGAEQMLEENAALRARYNALREAVAWERETYVFWEFGRTSTLVANDEALESMFAARAEVDRLMEEEG